MLKVNFYEIKDINDVNLRFAVIVSRYKGKWVLVRHRERETWEIPGGRREVGESIWDTAFRELHEETGATKFKIRTLCTYSVDNGMEESFGQLYFSDITEIGVLGKSEIAEVEFFDELPNNLTYPLIQPVLLSKAIETLGFNKASTGLDYQH